MAQVFEGPGQWLLLASNSAQMQNGSGMYLSYAEMVIEHGRITIGSVEPTLGLLPAAPVPLDPDQAARWPWMDPNGDFRHLGTSPRFDATASTAARLFEAAGHGKVDGVLAVDPFALQALLQVAGPVEVDGQTVDARGVVQDLLHDQYAVFATDESSSEVQSARRDRLGKVARAAMVAFERAAHVERTGLDVLAAAARGRHLMAWSPAHGPQDAFEAAQIAGRLPEDGLLLSIVNRGGNKLDWSLEVDASLTALSDPSGDVVEVHAHLTNHVTAGEPRYVAGPYPGSGLSPGQYLGVATLTVPGSATGLEVVGAVPLVIGPDGSHQVIGSRVLVDPAGAADIVFRFRLPPGLHELDIVPAARAQLTRWRFAGVGGGAQAWEDVEPRRVRWPPSLP